MMDGAPKLHSIDNGKERDISKEGQAKHSEFIEGIKERLKGIWGNIVLTGMAGGTFGALVHEVIKNNQVTNLESTSAVVLGIVTLYHMSKAAKGIEGLNADIDRELLATKEVK